MIWSSNNKWGSKLRQCHLRGIWRKLRARNDALLPPEITSLRLRAASHTRTVRSANAETSVGSRRSAQCTVLTAARCFPGASTSK